MNRNVRYQDWLQRRGLPERGTLQATWWARACATLMLAAMTAIAAPAQTFKALQSFNSTDGANPTAGLIQATNGYLYGTTDTGGPVGGGTVFRIAPSGALTTLYSFCSQSGCTDGFEPFGALVQATDGNFYGTTEGGGTNGYGTVFKITPSGTLTTLYSFCSNIGCTDGYYPLAALVQGSGGNFYGTTWYGGANGEGTVFKITPTGMLTTLYSFCAQSNCTDGAEPHAGLIEGTDGNFYGTTEGGTSSLGTVFKITPTGTLTTLHSFGLTDGGNPYAGLVQGSDGNFYGTTVDGGTGGGCTYGCGTVFKMTPTGTLTTLHSFDFTDGAGPTGLIQATNGNFYGTTSIDGANSAGTVFTISPTGTLTTLYNFCSQSGCTDGDGPVAGLVQDTNGNFYGTTYSGGTFASGTVFGLSVGLRSFVETEPASGKVGAAVKILGTNLTGATSVTFNGTAAVFKVVSNSLITTTVPTGATTGTVQVTTPHRTLNSNVPFRVLP
jgi:uncharacterized repeat protein (TIGR03803 family)